MVSIIHAIAFLTLTFIASATPLPETEAETEAVASRVASAMVSVVTGLDGIAGTVGGAVGSVPALVEATCNADHTSCLATVSGQIENLLVDGHQFTGMATVNAWTNNGSSYGNATLAGSAPCPFTISCNATANVCSGNISASATALFSNGKQIEAWGWLSPSGRCSNGTCTGSLTASGDPYY